VQSVHDQVDVFSFAGQQISSAQVKRPRGHPSNPLRPGELRAKFMDCMAAGSVDANTEQLFSTLEHIDRLESISGLLTYGKEIANNRHNREVQREIS
jgi:hypothetical protein